MKTTLKYNTIETFQRQPAWKKFIDTIVDDCKGLYDDHLIAVADSDTDLMSIYTFDEQHNNPKELGLYEFYNNRYILTKDTTVEVGKTYFKKDVSDVEYPTHITTDYINSSMLMNIKENISLRGLLHTLNLYGCKICDIKLEDVKLPHTFKSERRTSLSDNSVWGSYMIGSVGYDFEARATVDGVDNQVLEYSINGEEPEKYKYTFDYIKDLYGYNQKKPVIKVSNMREVTKHLYYRRKTVSEYGEDKGIELLPKYVFIESKNVFYDGGNFAIDTELIYYAESYDYAHTGHNDSAVILVGNFFNVSIDENGVITRVPASQKIDANTVIKECYISISNETWFWHKNESSNAKIYTDLEKDDLINDNGRIIYNDSERHLDTYENMSFDYNNDVIKVTLENVDVIGNRPEIEQTTLESRQYQVYEDSFYNKRWIVLDSVSDYFNFSLPYKKNQLYTEECALKAQPLFLYENNEKVSMCANLIKTTGGEEKITYELEKHIVNKIQNSETDLVNNTTLNTTPALAQKNQISDVSYGSYFYKWELYNKDNLTYVQDVYTPIFFSNETKSDTSLENMCYFFNENNQLSERIRQDLDTFTNNETKEIRFGSNTYIAINTHRKEFFETMYFNHFVNVYPITDDSTDNLVETTKLYCDNLELVSFGNVIPYVVSYDRKGEYEENTETGEFYYNDIDCSVFSKILSYNNKTHLLTVEKPIAFENPSANKRVVIAYQNASPFNKIKSLTIVAPNSVKDVVGELLEDYKNNNYELKLYSESEYNKL